MTPRPFSPPSVAAYLDIVNIICLLQYVYGCPLPWQYHCLVSLTDPKEDLVQPKMSPKLPFSVMYQNHLFIVGKGPILNKELGFIYWSDRSDRTYIYT